MKDDSFTYEIDDSESICEAVVRAVAACSGYKLVPDSVDQGAADVLDPLYTAVDPDALENLFRRPTDGARQGDCRVDFVLDGYEVTVHSYGIIHVRPHEQEADGE